MQIRSAGKTWLTNPVNLEDIMLFIFWKIKLGYFVFSAKFYISFGNHQKDISCTTINRIMGFTNR